MIFRSCVITMLLTVVVLLSTGCASPGGSDDGLKIQITGVSWLCENIDLSYWTSGFDDATELAMFSVHYSGDDISASDIQSAIFRCQGVSWSFNLDPGNVDTDAKIIGTTANRFYTTAIDSKGSAFPVGPTTFEVTLNNGKKATHVLTVPPPASTAWASQKCVYNEDYTGTIYTDYAAMVKRAVVGTYSNSGSSISAQFSSSDPSLFSGYVWFYDAGGVYVGRSDYFRSYGSGANASFVNGGLGLHSEGSTNTLSIGTGNVVYQSGRSFADIAKFRIILTDGVQYLGTSQTYDCRSIGALCTF